MAKLDRLFDKIRRSSDSSMDHPAITLTKSQENTRSLRNRTRSLSLMSNGSSSTLNLTTSVDGRARSKSINKRNTKDLIKLETKQVVQKKLASLLNDLGLQNPMLVKTNQSNSSSLSKNVSIYVANTNNCVYLAPASSASFTYEDVENGGIPSANTDNNYVSDEEMEEGFSGDPGAGDGSEAEEVTENPLSDNIPKELKSKLEYLKSPNYLCTKIDSDTPIPHTFGVIIELHKDTPLNLVKFEFSSVTNILWPSGDPYNKTFTKEKFKIGKLDWIKSLDNADYYINNLNSSDFKAKKIDQNELAKRTRYYRLKNVKDLSSSHKNSNVGFNTDDLNTDFPSFEEDLDEFYDQSNDSQPVYKAGIYIFLLPILIPEHIPQTITSINGSLNHLLSVSVQKNSEKLNRKLTLTAAYNLPMVRTPPSLANSVTDKPIYVNRIWNNALHYIITFPRKYVALGSEHAINVKIVPLVKDVVIKRIKFNVLERITYISKDLSREYDYDGEDPYYLKPLVGDNKVRERVISVCELKTKNKPTSGSSEPYKEEVIKCPDNNLLFSCYEPDATTNVHDDDIENFKLDDPLSKRGSPSHGHHLFSDGGSSSPRSGKKRNNGSHDKDSDDLMVASPLDINIALPFLTTRNDKIIQTSNDEEQLRKLSTSSSPASRKASIMSMPDAPNAAYTPSSPIIGALGTNLSHNHSELFKNDEEHELLTPDSSALMHEISHNHFKENIQHGFTTVGRALYPDSNFRNIQIYHRLQVCFRISKPDPGDNNKMHHYEVVVDTPLILLSSKCNEESVQLPKYDEIDIQEPSGTSPGLQPSATNQSSVSFRTPNYDRSHVGYSTNKNGEVRGKGFSIKPWDQSASVDGLPSFEEATSPMTSPITRSFSVSEDPLSRVPSISIDSPVSPNDPPAYDPTTSPFYGDSLNIDAVVNDAAVENAAVGRSSRLRTSLVNSFAPPMAPSSSLNLNEPDTGLSVSPSNVSSIPMLNINDGGSNSGSVSRTNSCLSHSAISRIQKSESSFSLESPESGSNVQDSVSSGSIESSENAPSFRIINDATSTGITTEASSHGSSGKDGSEESSLGSGANLSESDPLSQSAVGSDQPTEYPATAPHSFAPPEPRPLTEVTEAVEETEVTESADQQDSGSAMSTPAGDQKLTPVVSVASSQARPTHSAFDGQIRPLLKSYGTDNSVVSREYTPDSDFVSPHKRLADLANDSESNISLITQDGSGYDQRVPLLRNMSTESNIPLSKQVFPGHKTSTDNLSMISESKKVQDIYHTY